MNETGVKEARTVTPKAAVSPAVADLRNMAAFIAFIAVTAILLHVAITVGLWRIPTSRFGVSNAIVNGTINADILIAGSSRALTHYDPRIIKSRTGLSAYNIGVNGAQTDMQVAWVKTYLRHNTAPAALLFNLDVFTFKMTHGGVFDPGQYMPYLNEPDIYDALKRIDPQIWKSKFIPLYGYTVQDLRFNWILGLAGLLHWRPAEDRFMGFEPRYTQWTDDFARMRASHPEGARFEMEAAGIEQMEDLLRLCQSRGIRVILVYSPEYLEMQRVTRNRAEVFEKFDELTRRFNLTFWDYSGSELSVSEQNFYNSQHLNAQGAEKFSHALAERIAADPMLAGAAAQARSAGVAGPR